MSQNLARFLVYVVLRPLGEVTSHCHNTPMSLRVNSHCHNTPMSLRGVQVINSGREKGTIWSKNILTQRHTFNVLIHIDETFLHLSIFFMCYVVSFLGVLVQNDVFFVDTLHNRLKATKCYETNCNTNCSVIFTILFRITVIYSAFIINVLQIFTCE